MAKMTDAEVRAELERVRPVLEMDFIMSKEESPHRLALTLLAETSLRDRESQQALGEIGKLIEKVGYHAWTNYEVSEIRKIARTHYKGGK